MIWQFIRRKHSKKLSNNEISWDFRGPLLDTFISIQNLIGGRINIAPDPVTVIEQYSDVGPLHQQD